MNIAAIKEIKYPTFILHSFFQLINIDLLLKQRNILCILLIKTFAYTRIQNYIDKNIQNVIFGKHIIKFIIYK